MPPGRRKCVRLPAMMGRWWGGGQDGLEYEGRPEGRGYIDEGNAHGDSGVRDISGRTLIIEVARQVLRLLHQHRQQENRLGREAEAAMTSAIARDSVRLIVMGFMGYHQEEQCLERVACEAGNVLTRFYPSASLFLSALDLVAPPNMRDVVRLAKDASLGLSCVVYRCGEAYYPNDNEVIT
ncbi:uncharacterized protein LOC135094368 isoform X2 [Scylla paramamosain]|uniref:uncharacterized protein LOC135094368 isoform X2 n=1 Tax=Scylla paramamosain TaxID=85552 RepID=UPI003083CCFF